ncbi:MAG: metal ABC transporter ATP-binding protein [Candidatus Moraniibacteriota bacterium]|nr:MAG: metal ABC transporter ATP-binding protein [Candidatus Moranbacteria bacterium]
MTEAKSIIKASHLSFSYRTEQPILDDLSLSVVAGDYIGLIGPNGSGKSTLLKLLLGLIPIQHGTITLFGQPVRAFRDWSKIGYVPQVGFQGESNFPATVAEVVTAGSLSKSFFLSRKDRQALRERVDTVADIVGIRHLLQRRIGELSGGEEQRAFIAQALVSDPALLVLDEPTAGVDLATEESFYALLRDLNEKHGKTILLVSHDLEALAHNTKTALCLNKTVVYFGPAEGLHKRRVIEAAFGSRAWHPSEDSTL